MPSPRISVVIALGICLVGPTVVLAEPGHPPEGNDAAAARARAGNWVQVDPQTGRRIPASSRAVALPPDPAFSTSHQGLVQQPAPSGMMVDLQGRFRSAATATVGPDGTAQLNCERPGVADHEE